MQKLTGTQLVIYINLLQNKKHMRFSDIQDYLNKSKVYSYNTITKALEKLISLHLMTCTNKIYQVQDEKNFKAINK